MDKLNNKLSNLKKASNRLSKDLSIADTRDHTLLEKQGIIQGFEYTFELAWKTLRIFLLDKGEKTYGTKDILRKATEHEIITGDIWIEMLESRNSTSHTYDEEIAEEIYHKIKYDYSTSFLELVEHLTRIIK